MQILFISGFLGAGKTTFIQAMVKATGRQFAILENEFSSFNIDAPVLSAETARVGTESELKIWEMTEGCICCSTQMDFSSTVLTIANAVDPDFLIVEPSGVALTSRILHNIRPICYERIGLLAPIVILDAQHYETSAQDFTTYFEDQLQSADTVVMSKSENLSEAEFRAIRDELKLRPDVDFPLVHYSKWDEAQWQKIFHKRIVWDDHAEGFHIERQSEHKGAADGEDLEHFGLSPFCPPSLGFLVNRLEALLSGYWGRLARAKGYFSIGDEGYRFDLVDGSYTITGFDKLDDSKAVFIGRHLKRAELRAIFKAPRPRIREGNRDQSLLKRPRAKAKKSS